MLQSFSKNGYAISLRLISSSEIEFLTKEVAKFYFHQTRHLQAKVKNIQELANSNKIIDILSDFFKTDFQLVRALYFSFYMHFIKLLNRAIAELFT